MYSWQGPIEQFAVTAQWQAISEHIKPAGAATPAPDVMAPQAPAAPVAAAAAPAPTAALAPTMAAMQVAQTATMAPCIAPEPAPGFGTSQPQPAVPVPDVEDTATRPRTGAIARPQAHPVSASQPRIVETTGGLRAVGATTVRRESVFVRGTPSPYLEQLFTPPSPEPEPEPEPRRASWVFPAIAVATGVIGAVVGLVIGMLLS